MRVGSAYPIELSVASAGVQALRQLLRRPENSQCADCVGGGRPAWASINCGVFICLSCAGLHRGLGVHVSQAGDSSFMLESQIRLLTMQYNGEG